ncbi:glucosaminidase domain-containing protein [Solibacillus sp. CAU 1738]|uniref:glucosaminidase domain-containing protein n=1 Tax=Solibacillus sp. CAU 1738 TaxID=3140363 RepID=UPI0032602EA0
MKSLKKQLQSILIIVVVLSILGSLGIVLINTISTQTAIPEPQYIEENPSVEEFIGEIAETARQLSADNDLYASVMIAQAILESNYGQSGLGSSPYNNLFGMKGKYKNNSATFATSEDDGAGNMSTIQAEFRKYPSYKDSMEDYVRLLRNGVSWNKDIYKGAFKSNSNSYADATKHLTGTYATDSKYNEKLNQLIIEYDLQQYDQPVKDKTTITVSDGDSLHQIAQAYDVKVTSIKQWNQLRSDTVESGQKLNIYHY